MRLSYSNLSLFRQCPLKWYYRYVERLNEKPGPPLIVGDLFHRLLEAEYTGGDKKAIIEEYEDAVGSGLLSTEKNLLADVLIEYKKHYAKSDAREKILSIEEEMEVEWEDGDTLVGLADKIIEVDDLIIVRDTKTTFNALKYTGDDVMYSPQFLLYAALVEQKHKIKVDAVEVDEVRIASLEKPPINKNGRPTADIKRLSLVKYEDYYNKLVDLGLEDEPEYENVLKKLKERGHPLFRRITIQIVDDTLVNTIINDLYSTYKQMKQLMADEGLAYPRHRSRLCNWCGYKELCNLDHYQPEDRDRDVVISKNLIKKDDDKS